MKELYLNFKTYKVILFFLLPLFQFGFAIFGIIDGVIVASILFLVFIGPNTIWTLNFIYLFRKTFPLIIREKEIVYSVAGLKIEVDDIQLIQLTHNKSLLLVIHLNNFEKYKAQLSKTIIGKLLLLNYKFMGKDSIFINVSVFDINKTELSNSLKTILSKTKYSF